MTPGNQHDPDVLSAETDTEQVMPEQRHRLTNPALIKGLLASVLFLLTLSVSGAYVVSAKDAPEPVVLVIWIVFCVVVSFGYIQFLIGDFETIAERYRGPIKMFAEIAEFFASFLYWL